MDDAKSNISKESTKQKLTLGIDKNVIEKAKAAGINISAITENLLKAMTYEPKNDENTTYDVARAYEALLNEAWSLLSKYDLTGSFDVNVGQWEYDMEKQAGTIICFNSHMGLAICYDVPGRPIQEPDVSVDKVLEALYDPMKILENLIAALTRAAESNKALITELKLAMRIVKALSNNEEEGEHKK